MKPKVRRAKLRADWWWIVHRRRGRVVVILDEAVPRGGPAEEQLVVLAMRDWRDRHAARIGVFPASMAAAAAVVLVVAVGVAYVLTGDGASAGAGPADGWAEAADRPSSVAAPARPGRVSPGPVRSVDAGRSVPVAASPSSSAPAQVTPVPSLAPTAALPSPRVVAPVERVTRHPRRFVLHPARRVVPVRVRPGLRIPTTPQEVCRVLPGPGQGSRVC